MLKWGAGLDKQAGRKESPFLRKIITVISLPLIIFIWMTGWTLTRIGEPVKSTKPSQKVFKIHPRCESFSKESEA